MLEKIPQIKQFFVAVTASVLSFVGIQAPEAKELPEPIPVVEVSSSPSPVVTTKPILSPSPVATKSSSTPLSSDDSKREELAIFENFVVPEKNLEEKADLCKEKIRELEANFEKKLEENGDPFAKHVDQRKKIEAEYCN